MKITLNSIKSFWKTAYYAIVLCCILFAGADVCALTPAQPLVTTDSGKDFTSSESSVKLEGTAEGLIAAVYVNSSKNGVTFSPSISGGTSLWSYTGTLQPGANAFRIVAEDLTGQKSAETLITVTYEPPVPLNPPVVTTNGGQNFTTAEASVKLDGTCTAVAAIYVNGSEDGVSYTAGQTAWSYSGTLQPGANTFKIIAEDSAGKKSAETLITVTYEPPVPLNPPVVTTNGGQNFTTAEASVKLDGTCTAVAAIYVNGSEDGVSYTAGQTAWSYSGTLQPGANAFKIVAEDSAGKKSAETSITVTYEPPVPLNPPVVTTNGGQNFTVAEASVKLDGTCTAVAAIYVSGSQDGVSYTAGQTAWSYSGTLQPGANAFKIVAEDSAGKKSAETLITVTYQPPDTEPPVSGAIAVPAYGNSDISITWTASDNQSGVAAVELWYKKGDSGTWANTGIPAQTGTGGSFTYKPVSGDTYYFATRSKDNAGNSEAVPSGSGDTATVFDTLPPDSPLIDKDYKESDPVTLSGTCAADTVEIRVNNATAGVTYTPGQTAWSYTGSVQPGDNLFNVTALDVAGNTSLPNSVTVSYQLPETDTAPPESVAAAPASANGPVSINWTASDSHSGVASTRLLYKKEGGKYENTGLQAQEGTAGTFVYTPAQGDGTYYFATRSTDNAGNAEAMPAGDGDSHTVVDTTPPAAPVITANSGNNYSAAESSLTLTGTCAADSVEIQINSNSTGVAYTAGQTDWTYTGTLQQGANVFTVVAKDAAGNVSLSASITITYEPPQPQSVSIAVEWEPVTVAELDHYVVYWGTASRAYTYESGTIAKTASSYSVNNLIEDQIYYLAVKAFYTDGSSSEYSNEAAIPAITFPKDGFHVEGSNAGNYKLTGTAAELSQVDIFSGEILLGTATANGYQQGATWSKTVDFTPLSGGALSLTAKSTGAASKAVTGNYEPATADITPPESKASAPAYGKGVLSIQWTASDSGGVVASTELWYKKGTDGKWANTGLSAQEGMSGTFAYTPGEKDGTYYFAARSTDNAGNIEAEPSGSGDSSTVYDTTPPIAPVITSNAGRDYSTGDSSAALTGTCSADTVAVYINGSADGVSYTPGQTSWSYTADLVPEENSFKVSARDAAGNISAENVIRVYYEETPTQVSITLSWDPVNDPNFDHYMLYWGTQTRAYPFNSDDNPEEVVRLGATSYTVKYLLNRTVYYFAVRAVYTDGQISGFSNEAAIPAISNPQNGFYADENTSAAFPVSGTSAEYADVEFFAGDTLVGKAKASGAAAGSKWSGTADFSSIPLGTVTLRAKSTGAESEQIVGTYDTASFDDIPPESQAVAPETASGYIPVTWTASDNRSVAAVELWYKKETAGRVVSVWTDTGLPAQPGTEGTFIYTPSEGDGTYYFATLAEDAAGNEESLPEENGYVLTVYDTESPDSPVIADDYSVSDNSVTLSGTCSADALAVYVNGSAIGVSYIPGETSWTYSGTLQEGSNTFAVTAKDKAGNISSETSVQIPYQSAPDTVPPDSTATAPRYGNAALNIAWTASDDRSGVSSTKLLYKKDAGVWTNTGLSGQSGTAGTFVYTPADGDGIYYFATRSTDKAGNAEASPKGQGDSQTAFDTVPPDAPVIVSPVNGHWTDDYEIILTGTCPADTAEIYVSGSAGSVTYTPGETSWRYIGILLAGDNVIEVIAKDAAGNASPETSVNVYFDPPPDTDPPMSEVTSLTYKNGSFAAEWAASDYIAGVASTTLWYKKGSDGIWADTGLSAMKGTKGIFVYKPDSDENGVMYYFATRSQDNRRNLEAEPLGDGDAAMFYDTVAPAAPTITTNAGRDYSTTDYRLTLKGISPSDAAVIYVNGSIKGVSYTEGAASWTYTGTLVSGGNRFDVTAGDKGGNISSAASVRIDYDSPQQDITPPSSSASVSDNSVAAILISWTAYDYESGIASTRLWYKKEGSGLWADTGLEAQSGVSGEFAYTPKEGGGIYYFAAQSTDNAGNTEAAPAGNGDDSTAYDETPPDPPISGGYSIVNAVLTLTGTCSSDIAAIYVNGSTEGVTYTPGSTTWSYSGGLQLGENPLILTARDAVGNESIPNTAVIRYYPDDKKAPNSKALSPAYANAEISVTWKSQDDISGANSTVLWYKKGTEGLWADTGLPAQSGDSGIFVYIPVEGDGIYYFATRSTDNAGHVEAEPKGEGGSTTVYDTAPPEPPVITTNAGKDFATSDTNVTLTGTCGSDIAKIAVNSSQDGVSHAQGETVWSYAGTLQSGINRFTVTAKDMSGNMSVGAVIRVHVGLPGQVTITTNSGEDFVAEESSVVLEGTCVAETASISVNGSIYGLVYTPGETLWRYATTVMPGSNLFTVRAKDQAGNVTEDSVRVSYVPTGEAAITLEWEPVTEPSLDYYVVYWGASSRNYTHNSDKVAKEEVSYTVTNLSEGAIYYFAAKAFYTDGRVSDYSNEAAIPAITSPDSGFESNDSNYKSFMLSGTSAESALVEIFAGDTLIGNTQAFADATWEKSLDFTAIEPGEIQLTVKSTGATSLPVIGTYTRTIEPADTQAPESLAESPAYAKETFNISWSATDDLSGLALTRLRYKKGEDGVWADTGLPAQEGTEGIFTYTPAEGDGLYCFATRSADADGNVEPEPVGDGDTKTLYDTQPPDAPLITNDGGEDYITDTVSVTIEGTCDTDTAMILINEVSDRISYTTGETVWSYDTELKPGINEFRIKAQDASGNMSEESMIRITYEPDTLPPSSDAVSPSHANRDFPVEWTASDTGLGIASVSLWYKKGSKGTWADTGFPPQTGESGTFVYKPTGGDDTYYFATLAVDHAGNAEAQPSDEGDTQTVYDTLGPEPPVILTNQGYDYTVAESSLTLEGTAGTDSVAVYVNGEEVKLTDLLTWTYTGSLNPGQNFFVVTAKDKTGNESPGASVAVLYEPDTATPESAAAAPTYGTGSLSIVWTASDSGAGLVSVSLWYKKGESGTWLDTGLPAQSGEVGTFVYTPSEGDDVYYFATRAEDKVGNIEAQPTGKGDDSSIYDTAQPESLAAAPKYGTGAIPVEWGVQESGSGLASVALWYKKGDAGIWQDTGLPAQTGSGGVFSYSPAQGDDTYYFATRAEDKAGNIEAEPAGAGDTQVIVDTVSPAAPVINRDYSISGNIITLSGTCSADSAVIYVNSSVNSVAFTAGETIWYYTATLQAGDNVFEATAEDAAGHLSEKDSLTVMFGMPAGGYVDENVIPAGQISQSSDGHGIITVSFRIKDPMSDSLCTLHGFEYSLDAGASWNTPINGDNSEAFSTGWQNNKGDYYRSAAIFDRAADHSFTFDTRHSDIAGLDGKEQRPVQIRFKVGNGTYDSLLPVTSESFGVDNLGPNAEISYSKPGPYRSGDSIGITAAFSDMNPIAGKPEIRIIYGNEEESPAAAAMTATGDNAVWKYAATIPADISGTAAVRITAKDTTGNPLEDISDDTFEIDNIVPKIHDCAIDYDARTVDIVFSEAEMRNAAIKNNYSFAPSLDFAADDIAELGNGAYRLFMKDVPEHTVFTLTVSNITDAAGNAVSPDSTTLNDENGNGMADDLEQDIIGKDPDGDADKDGLSNRREWETGTDFNNPDTDGDGLPDGWEITYGLDPDDGAGSNGKDGDADNDGWTNVEEYESGYNPGDKTSAPAPTPPEIIDVMPHSGAGMEQDRTRIPGNTSFYVRIQDSDGIAVTEPDSVIFTVTDEVNEAYTRNLGSDVVRRINLSGEDETKISDLWVVYDRSVEPEFGNYGYDEVIHIDVSVSDRRHAVTQLRYSFKTESSTAHDTAQAGSPETAYIEADDPRLQGLYNEGIRVTGGKLEGAAIVYNSDEPVKPIFGPENELPTLMIANVQAVGSPLSLQPPTVFDIPVKVIIPCPGDTDVNEMNIYLCNGKKWAIACDTAGTVMPAGDGWIVPGSRVNHKETSPQTIEIQVWHFSGVQAGYLESDGGGGGCFIETAAFDSTPGKILGFTVALLSLIGCLILCLSVYRKRS